MNANVRKHVRARANANETIATRTSAAGVVPDCTTAVVLGGGGAVLACRVAEVERRRCGRCWRLQLLRCWHWHWH